MVRNNEIDDSNSNKGNRKNMNLERYYAEPTWNIIRDVRKRVHTEVEIEDQEAMDKKNITEPHT